ncbi:hypothetical protein LPY66_20255 [Dehalobacter sp. DCM]|uniref:hypothetical protein n=1 Tax=Dehalobacter sp. DCM TaxID=2907827 RepID=UPI003081B8CC|nr:hypothetical protein LPY66_20255 [Dehalobacter sp. DCM]
MDLHLSSAPCNATSRVMVTSLVFDFEDMEKEIYMIRKTTGRTTGIVMNIESSDIFEPRVRGDVKVRLEKRFPGLTVNFVRREHML